MKQQAFTFIELMVVLAVAGILVATAAPSFSTYLTNKNSASIKSRLLMDIRYARVEADTRDEVIAVEHLNNSWDKGWQVKIKNGAILKKTEFENTPSGTISTAATKIEFDQFGRHGSTAELDIKLAGCKGDHAYKITVTTLGQVSVGNLSCN